MRKNLKRAHTCWDLDAQLVLLQNSPLGFTAKVADFGLSREMQSTSRIETHTCGTITHMPPELLSDDVVSKVRSNPWRDCIWAIPASGRFPHSAKRCLGCWVLQQLCVAAATHKTAAKAQRGWSWCRQRTCMHLAC